MQRLLLLPFPGVAPLEKRGQLTSINRNYELPRHDMCCRNPYCFKPLRSKHIQLGRGTGVGERKAIPEHNRPPSNQAWSILCYLLACWYQWLSLGCFIVLHLHCPFCYRLVKSLLLPLRLVSGQGLYYMPISSRKLKFFPACTICRMRHPWKDLAISQVSMGDHMCVLQMCCLFLPHSRMKKSKKGWLMFSLRLYVSISQPAGQHHYIVPSELGESVVCSLHVLLPLGAPVSTCCSNQLG